MLKVHLEAVTALQGLLERVFYGSGGPEAESRVRGVMVGAVPFPGIESVREPPRTALS